MKIGFFLNTYLPNLYGSTTSVENFRIGLEKLGHEVYVFAPKYKGYENKNPRVISYPSFMYGYKIKYPIPFAWDPGTYKKALELDLDIVHAHQPFSIGKQGARVARKMKIPLVFTHHARYDDYSHYILPILSQKRVKKIIRSLVAGFGNRCDKVLSPSDSMQEYIKEEGIKTSIETLSTGIDWERFQKGDGEKIREKFGIKKEAKVILYLGRIEEEKNLTFLSDAVFDVMEKEKDVCFLVVGEGSLKEGIEAKAKKLGLGSRVFFVGLVDQSVVQDYYSAADIFVHASQTETQGMTIPEAMASGLAVVAVKGTGVSDQIDDLKNGFLVDCEKEQFLQKIKACSNDKQLREKLGENAAEKAREIDFFNQAKKLEGIYKKLLVEKN